MTDSVTVNIKYKQQSIPMTLPLDITILQLKEILKDKIDESPKDQNIIYKGYTSPRKNIRRKLHSAIT
jgi:hypothetical protein